MKSVRDREAGFLLVESIAVLGLSVLVLATLILATSLITRNSAAATRRVNAVEGLATGLMALRRDIDAVQPLRDGGPEGALLFQGDAQSLAFPVKDDGSDLGFDNSVIKIEARYENGVGMLVRSSAPLPSSGGFEGASFSNAAILLSGPWTYRFSYGKAESGPLQWVAGWFGLNALPDAVRLEVLDARGAAPVVPPLVSALPIDMEFGCDETDKGCAAEKRQDEDTDDDEEGSADGSDEGE